MGEYQVTYGPRSLETLPLKYGVNIRAIDDVATTPEAEFVSSGKTSHGLPAGLRVFTWHNPHPERTIANIVFATYHPYASPILLGMTTLNDPEAK